MDGQGFIAVYRWKVADQHRSAFVERWRAATLELRELGGLGSVLGEDESGNLAAVALWPDAATRERAFASSTDSAPWPPSERLDPMTLEVIDDLWAVSSFREQ